MTYRNWKNSLRPTFLVVFSLAVSIALCLAISSFFPVKKPLDPFNELVERVSGLKQPSEDLSPEEVVRVQVEAVAYDDWGRGAMQCMYFASPANRSITGPFDRFGRMLRSPPFEVLSNPDQVLIGNATMIQGTARVLVTVVKERELYVFVWCLTRQTEPPYTGCWMTEGVFPYDEEGNDQQPTESVDKVASEAH